MPLTPKEKKVFINNVRDAANQILKGVNELKFLRDQWDALDMGGSLTDDRLQDSDFTDDNIGLSAADVINVFGSTLPALKTLLNQGHATNLFRVRR